MELLDFIVAPIVILLVLYAAFKIRPRVTDNSTRRYFIPALVLKVVSAILLGVIYQFHYGYGDTLNYHSKGSRIIYQAFMNDPIIGLKLLMGGGTYEPETFMYASKILFYEYDNAYIIVKIAAFFDLFTFSSYSGTAVLFAAFSFMGCWMMFLVFYKKYPNLHLHFAMAVFFMPSVFFWGSGILKDTLTFAFLGIALYYFDLIVANRKKRVVNVIILLAAIYFIYLVKFYILLCFIPAILIWLFYGQLKRIKSKAARIVVSPIIILLVLILGFWLISSAGEFDRRFSLENIGETARITGVDLAYGTGLGAGSTYILGKLDGSIQSMLALFPSAINVTLFRPYIWEVNNVLMLVAALESLLILLLTIYTFIKVGFFGLFKFLDNPFLLSCIVFSIVFSFAVGVSTFNFGTLMRYKIPIIPFYLSSLFIIINNYKKPKFLIPPT